MRAFLSLGILFILFFFQPLTAVDIFLRGHLDETAFEQASQSLEIISSRTEDINLYINSSSGLLSPTIDFAKALYQKRQENNFRINVSIEEYAIGPAAILPFIADNLFISSFITWGDITLNETQTPLNILKSILQNLIPKNSPNYNLLASIAHAMIDPNANRSLIEQQLKSSSINASNSSQALVFSHTEIIELNLGSYYQIQTNPSPTTVTNLDSVHLPFTTINFSDSMTAGHIYIGDKTSIINQGTWIYVKAALEYYKENRPNFIILHLNTPGGEVFSSQQISDALKNYDEQTGIPIIALIDDWAISAGAMLAYSCRYIVTTPSASMGAAAPVIQSSQGMVAASEKITSALRSDFANRAGFYDRNPLLAQAMVDKDFLLVKRSNAIISLENESQIHSEGINPDTVIIRKDKLLTLTADQLIKFNVATAAVESAKNTFDPEKTIPLQSNISLFTHPIFNNTKVTIDAYQMDWKIQFISFLLNPAIASFLFLGVMLGFYMELSTPGFGFPGLIGLSCLFLIGLSSFAHVSLPILEFIFIGLGLILIGIEFFILPGFGIAGFVGFTCFIGGTIALLLPELGSVEFTWDTQSFNAAGVSLINRLVYLISALFIGLAIMIFSSRWLLPIIQRTNPLIHRGEQNANMGYESHKISTFKSVTVGDKGQAVSILRPSGKVDINGQVYEATTEMGFIDESSPISVTAIKANTLIVIEDKG